MKAVVQRVLSSSVKIDGKTAGKIDKGLNVLFGAANGDTLEDADYLCSKIINLRIFEDENLRMNKSLLDAGGSLLIISQFTLLADCRHGRRPNFMDALSGKEAEKLYDYFVSICREKVKNVQTGIFGADMIVSIENDGPVTIILDSRDRK